MSNFDKANILQDNKQRKLDSLGYKKDVLLGMEDADTFTTQNLGKAREGRDDLFFDAAELRHGGKLPNKSEFSMDLQREQAAKLLNIPTEQVTEQDIVDVGNMQQVQKLADLARLPGEERWLAPLVRGSEQLDLTGRATDEQGNPIPLNIPIVSKDEGADPFGRRLASLGNLNQEEVTETSAVDPELNARVAQAAPLTFEDILSTTAEQDRDTLTDAVQFGVGRTVAGIGDTVVDAATRLVKEGYKYFGDMSEDEANAAMHENLTFSKDWFDANMDFVALDELKKPDAYGYSQKTTQKALDNLGKAYDSGDTMEMLKAVVEGTIDAGPKFFAESAGEVIGAMAGIPGLMALGSNYTNQILEERVKNKEAELDFEDRTLGFVGGMAMAVLNKLPVDEFLGKTNIVKSMINSAISKGDVVTAKALIKSAGTKALEATGKAGYEGIEEVLQESVGKFAEKFGTDAEQELYTDETGKELFQAFGGGVAGGAVPGAASAVATTGKETGKFTAEQLGTEIQKRKVKKAVKAEEVDQAEAEKEADIIIGENRINPQKARSVIAAMKVRKDAEALGEYKNTAVDSLLGDDEAKILGSDIDQVERLNRIRELVGLVADDGVLDADTKTKILENLGIKASDIETAKIKEAVEKGEREAKAESVLRKPQSEVAEEAALGGRGFVTYYNAAKAALAEGKTEEVDKYIQKLDNFAASHNNKIAVITEAEKEIVRDITARVDQKVREQGLSTAAAVKAVRKDVQSKKRSVPYGNEGRVWVWNYGTVVDKVLSRDPNFNMGGYQAFNAMKEEVTAMRELYTNVAEDLGINEPPKVQTAEEAIVEITAAVEAKDFKTARELVEKGNFTQATKDRLNKRIDANEPTKEETVEKAPAEVPQEEVAPEPEVEEVPEVEDSILDFDDLGIPDINELDIPDIDDIQAELDALNEIPEDFDVPAIEGTEEMVERKAKPKKLKTVMDVFDKLKDGEKALDEVRSRLIGASKDTKTEILEDVKKIEAGIKKLRDIADQQTAYMKTKLDERRKNYDNKVRVFGGNVPAVKMNKFLEVVEATGLNVVEIEETAQIKEYKGYLQKWLKDPNPGRKGVTADDSKGSPGRVLLYNDDGSMDSNTVAALDAALTAYLVEGFSDLTSAPEGLEISEMLPMVSDTEGLDLFFEGGAQLRKFEAEKIGTKVLDYLGLKGTKDTDEEMIQALKADLGMMAMLMGQEQGLVRVEDQSTWLDTSKLKLRRGFVGSKVPFVRPGSKLGDSIKSLRTKATILEDGYKVDVENRRTYSLGRPRFREEVEVHRQPYTTTTKEQAEVIRKMESTPYRVTGGMTELTRLFSRDGEVAKMKLKKAVGWTAIDKQIMGHDQQKAQDAKNKQIEQQIDDLLDMPTDRDIYFKWFITKGGRMNMDSVTVNPQSEKQLHRWLVTAQTSRTEVDVSDMQQLEDGKAVNDAMVGAAYAIAQAFGFDVDKNYEADIVKEASRILKLADTDLDSMVLNGKFDHLGQALTALSTIKAYKQAKDDSETFFTSEMVYEVDGKTNGFAFRLMQFPIGNYEKWLPKVGVTLKGTEHYKLDSMNALSASGVELDTYEAQAQGFEDRFGDLGDMQGQYDAMKKAGMLPDIAEVDGKVAKEVRNLMKTPTMTFNYSAGFNSIKAAVVKELLDSAVTQILAVDEKGNRVVSDSQLEAVFNDDGRKDIKAIDVRNIVRLNSMTSPAASAVNARLGDFYWNVHGKAIEESLQDNFGPYIELNNAINTSFDAMYKVMKRLYDAEITKLRKERKPVTSEKKIKIVRSLLEFAPAIKGPDSSSMDDAILVLGRALEDGVNNVQTQLNEEVAGKNSSAVSIVKRGIDNPGASGAVIPIHTMDGAAMLRSVIEHGILGVHDAQVLGIGQNDAVTKYNEDWYKLNRDYSIAEEVLKQLKRSVREAKRTNNNDVKAGLRDDKTLSDVVRDMEQQAETVRAGREKLFSHSMKVGQMVGPEGTMYKVEVKGKPAKIETNQVESTLFKIEPTKKPEIREGKGALKNVNPAARAEIIKSQKDC